MNKRINIYHTWILWVLNNPKQKGYIFLKVFENSRAGYPRISVLLQIYWAMIIVIYPERTTAIWYHFVYRGWTLWQVAKHLKKQNRQICLTSFQARHRLETIAHPKTPQSRIIYPNILSGWITTYFGTCHQPELVVWMFDHYPLLQQDTVPSERAKEGQVPPLLPTSCNRLWETDMARTIYII